MIGFTILAQWKPGLLLAGFSNDQATMAVAVQFLHFVSLNLVAQGMIFTCHSMFQGLGKETDAMNRDFGFDASEVDAMVLSHAHIDHCGLIPKLIKDGYNGKVFATPATKDLAAILMADSAGIQESDLKQLEHKLNLANVSATRNGVITYVNKNIGANVKEGETLLRIADLSSFKISGSLSDNYIDQLHNGMPVIVKVNDTQLQGHVSNVYPSVQNNLVTFDIQLNDRANKQLRPNLKVDVYLVTAVHNKVMRVANGAAFKGASPQDIFVVDGDGAQRRSVHTGLSNFDYIELQDGVKPGDVLITSDVSNFKNARQLKITN